MALPADYAERVYAGDRRALAVDGVAVTATFIPPEAQRMTGYELQACPTLYSGQTLRAHVEGAPFLLLVRAYDGRDELVTLRGPEGAAEWRVPFRRPRAPTRS